MSITIQVTNGPFLCSEVPMAGKSVLAECARLAEAVLAVDLAAHPEFQDVFMDCMMFPEPAAGSGA